MGYFYCYSWGYSEFRTTLVTSLVSMLHNVFAMGGLTILCTGNYSLIIVALAIYAL
jgi:hypothetical protein